MDQRKNEYNSITLSTKTLSLKHHQQQHYFLHHNVFRLITIDKSLKFGLISLIIFIIFFCIYYNIILNPKFNNYNIIHSYINNNNNNEYEKREKIILLYTDFFDNPTWEIEELKNENYVNQTYFMNKKCLQTNCILTYNRKLLPSIDLYDALIFHIAEKFELNEYFPQERNINQFYVFTTLESPAHTNHDISNEFNLYNLTMTYRLDSDILMAYAYIEDLQTKQIIAPSINPNWKIPIYEHLENDTKLINLIKNKNKFAAWFVSNCNTISKRNDIAKALQKYVKIDIYGKCGTFKCSRTSTDCNKQLDNDYKFYLSFENSLCKDYVTEKFFRALRHNIVPIVYGGADYNRFAPPHSYINIEDYPNIQELANYLEYLNKNSQEYLKYFWWKKYYKIVQQSPYCKLCELLNYQTRHEKTQFYKNIKNWWFGESCRLKPKIILQ